jgi:hypothetical protein
MPTPNCRNRKHTVFEAHEKLPAGTQFENTKIMSDD